jgi:hypothetical protein
MQESLPHKGRRKSLPARVHFQDHLYIMLTSPCLLGTPVRTSSGRPLAMSRSLPRPRSFARSARTDSSRNLAR